MLHNTGTADTAPLTVDGAQPVWMTLNEARQRAFTGEVVFEADPEVLAYLDNGTVYYAERASDAPLGRRLLDAGVIDHAQLERGAVRVGDIEHLGRLFDRDPSVDRDAVIVLAETSTEALIAELANGAITGVRVTAYRRHPSGVHRWFVAPLDAPAVSRPISSVAQLDTTVVDDLPGLSFVEADADELTIEWDDQIGETDHVTSNDEFDAPLRTVADQPSVDTAPAFDALVFEVSLAPAESTVHTDETVDAITDTVTDGADDTADDLAGFEFSIVWPDGSEEPATFDTAATGKPAPVGGLAPPTADVPDDVTEAARRAIAAIESASVAAPHVAPQPEAATPLPEIAEIAPIDPAPAVALGGFAAPTMATSDEETYAQMADDFSSVDSAPDVASRAPAESTAGGVASVVFIDDPVEVEDADDNDRSSALRRLIGGLRRKDH